MLFSEVPAPNGGRAQRRRRYWYARLCWPVTQHTEVTVSCVLFHSASRCLRIGLIRFRFVIFERVTSDLIHVTSISRPHSFLCFVWVIQAYGHMTTVPSVQGTCCDGFFLCVCPAVVALFVRTPCVLINVCVNYSRNIISAYRIVLFFSRYCNSKYVVRSN